MITMYREPLVELNLKHASPYFDLLVVVDGDKDSKLDEICAKYGAIRIYKPWTDYGSAYQTYLDYVGKQDQTLNWWATYFDDDEIPTKELMWNMPTMVEESKNGELYNVVWLPNLHLVGGRRRSNRSRNFWHFKTQPQVFRKPIFFKYRKGMKPEIVNGSHVTIVARNSPRWICVNKYYPYIHVKTIKTIISSEVYASFIKPTANGLTEEESDMLKSAFARFNIHTMDDLRRAFLEGLPEELEQQLIKWHLEYPYDNILSRYFMVYFYWKHPEKLTPELDDRQIVYEYYKARLGLTTDEKDWARKQFFASTSDDSLD
jgi:glycosyltransferase involved in cell wall biosynthesis